MIRGKMPLLRCIVIVRNLRDFVGSCDSRLEAALKQEDFP
jgi:hypothetical protein